jgi:NAD(P)-dependent dehydrogenase (short-subunit alcohol dehydrogenase family)
MRMSNLKNRKCFITGAASGIGRAVAVAAAARGAELFLTDINAPQLGAVVSQIQRSGGKVSLFKALDIADFDSVRTLAREIHESFGSMDVVMNIAGISVWGTVESLEHEHWKRCIDINLMGPIHVIECFVPQMIRAGKGGHLVNVSSAAGLFGLPWHAAYSASKFGLRGISEVLRFDLKRHGIGVSLVCPGGVNTGLVQTLDIPGIDKNEPEFVALREHFVKRAVTPEKAAAAILKGIKTNKYMVFTSFDIWLGYWSQRMFAPPYEFIMTKLNDRLHDLASRLRNAGVTR